MPWKPALAGLLLALALAGCDTPERHLVEGNRAYARGDRPAAVRSYQEAAKYDETRAVAQLNIGRVLLDSKEYAEARKFLDLGLAARPNSALARLHRARAELAMGQPREAQDDLEKAVLIEPATRKLWLELGRVRAQNGEVEEALQALGKARTAPSLQSEATFLSLPLYRQLGQTENALRELEELIANQPFLGRAYFELGALLLEREDYREAERRLRKGLELEPANRAGRLGLARALDQTGRWEQAEREYQAVVAGAETADDPLALQAREALQRAQGKKLSPGP